MCILQLRKYQCMNSIMIIPNTYLATNWKYYSQILILSNYSAIIQAIIVILSIQKCSVVTAVSKEMYVISELFLKKCTSYKPITPIPNTMYLTLQLASDHQVESYSPWNIEYWKYWEIFKSLWKNKNTNF